MKLASFHAQGRDRVGFSFNGACWFDLGAGAPRTMIDLIEGGADAMALVHAAARVAATDPDSVASFMADAITWHPPVRRPTKICCLALNNSANAGRIMRGPKHPVMFIKPASALIGHEGAIECRPEYGRVHPEPELAVIIGKTAKNIHASDAFDHVFGYTIHNDVTSPTMRQEDTLHYRAIHPKGGNASDIEYVDTWVSYSGRCKGADTFACLGPWLVTRDEIADPHDLDVACHHQGRLVTEDNTANLFYKTAEALAFLSAYTTLLPGDVVSMGTAQKQAAAGGAVQNVDLNKMGGPVSVTIEGIGTLTNHVLHVA